MKKILQFLCLVLLSVIPNIVWAATDFEGLIEDATTLVVTVSWLLVVLAVMLFFWGIVKFIWSAGDPSKKAEGKQIMTWGVVGLFVMVSFIGIIKFLQNSLFDDRTDLIELDPQDLIDPSSIPPPRS